MLAGIEIGAELHTTAAIADVEPKHRAAASSTTAVRLASRLARIFENMNCCPQQK
jgi:hypothetical protein